jgi:hypothetical protein
MSLLWIPLSCSSLPLQKKKFLGEKLLPELFLREHFSGVEDILNGMQPWQSSTSINIFILQNWTLPHLSLSPLSGSHYSTSTSVIFLL